MAKVHPKSKKLLEDFIDFLENRGNKNGWVIISKPSYEPGPMWRKSYNTRSKKSTRTLVKVQMEWLEMGQQDLDIEIDRFLRIQED